MATMSLVDKPCSKASKTSNKGCPE